MSVTQKISGPFIFLLRLDGSNRFSGHLQQDCLCIFPEVFWGDLILCSLQCRKPVGHLCCKLYCFVFLEFLEIQRRNAVLSSSLWGTNVGSRWTEGPDGRRAAVTVISVVGRSDWMSVTARRYFTTAAVWPFGRRALPPRIRHR